jgi:hypothetical protein
MTKSESIGALAGALAKAQGEIRGAAKDSLNPHFKNKYADLASVWDACRAALSKNGIAVTQVTGGEPPQVKVTTVLMHSSGEWIAGDLTMAAQQNTPQAIGSTITYARRYALAAAVGVAPDDDDGNAASGRPAPERAEQPEPTPSSNVDKVKAKVQAANGAKPDPAKQILGEAIVALGNEPDARAFLKAQRGEKVGSPVTEDELPGLRSALMARKKSKKNVDDAAGILSAQH